MALTEADRKEIERNRRNEICECGDLGTDHAGFVSEVGFHWFGPCTLCDCPRFSFNRFGDYFA